MTYIYKTKLELETRSSRANADETMKYGNRWRCTRERVEPEMDRRPEFRVEFRNSIGAREI